MPAFEVNSRGNLRLPMAGSTCGVARSCCSTPNSVTTGMRSLIQLYALAVCFATLMCLVVALGLGIYDVVRIVAPAFTVQDSMLWRSDEHFLMYNPDKKDLPPDERAALREKYRLEALDTERHSAQQRLVFVAILLAIDAVVYAIHWSIARRTEFQSASSAEQRKLA